MELEPLTIRKRGRDRVGVLFSTRALRGPYERIEYAGLDGCSPDEAEEHLSWLCNLAGGDLGSGRFSLSRNDAHRQGFSAEQFLQEGLGKIADHSAWSGDGHSRCIGSWIHFPGATDAPRIRAVSLLGEPHEFPRLEDYRINIIVTPGARPEQLDIPDVIEPHLEAPQEWDPSRIVIYPTEPSDREPIERRRTEQGEEVLLENPVRSTADGSILGFDVADDERSRGLDRLFDCNALQVAVREPRDTYRLRRIELVNLESLSTSGHQTWSITPVVEQ